MYVAYLARRLKYASIKQYINIVRIMHREAGRANPMVNDFHFEMTLKGIRRSLGDSVTQKTAFTPKMLHQLRNGLNLSLPKDIVVWAAALIMFFGLLRKSNVLLGSGQKFNPVRGICRSDMVMTHNGYQCRIKWSKTNQFGAKPTFAFFPRLPDHPLCPTRAIFRALQGAPGALPQDPALQYSNGGRMIPLSATIFLETIRRAMGGRGEGGLDLGTHGFRRGGATWAHACGLSPDTIKLLGHWRSNVYQRYLEPSEEQQAAAVNLMAISLPRA